MEIVSKGKMDTAQWTRAAAALDFAALFVLDTGHTEWLDTEFGLLGIALFGLFLFFQTTS